MASNLTLGMSSLSIARREKYVFVAIDVSGSMISRQAGGNKTRMQVAIDGACKVIDALNVGDNVLILYFNDTVLIAGGGLVTVTSEATKTSLKRSIRGLRPSGRTALYDTFMRGFLVIHEIAAMANEIGQAVAQDIGSFWFCLITDGEDTSSKSTLSDVTTIVQLLDVLLGSELMQLMIIGVSLPVGGRNALQAIANAGKRMTTFVNAEHMSQVSNAFDEFVLQYRQAEITLQASGNSVTTGTSNLALLGSSGTSNASPPSATTTTICTTPSGNKKKKSVTQKLIGFFRS